MFRSIVISFALLAPLPAFAKFVDDNNHPDLDWYTIETEHFSVHYPQSHKKKDNEHYLNAKWTAQRSAKIAEEMFPRMCAEFNYYLKERINIVILNHGDELEGFTVPNWDWIEVSANPGSDFYRMRSRMDWLPDVLVHEFAHVVSLKANGNFAEGVQAVAVGGLYSEGVGNTASGGEVLVGQNEPWYWTEGGAEYWSDQAGYNWWTPARDRTIRMSVLDDRLLSWDEWKTVQQNHGWIDGERGYQQGYSFGLYLRQRFGSETYNKMALENQKGWKFDWNENLEIVTGVPGPQLYKDWRAWVEKTYTDQYTALKESGETQHRELALKDNDWEYTDPAGRDAFNDPRWKRKWGVTGPIVARRERERAKEATGRWQMNPKWSDDGKYFGVSNLGSIEVNPLEEGSISAFSNEAAKDAGVSAALAKQSYSLDTWSQRTSGFQHDWDFVPGKNAVVVTASEHLGDDAKPGNVLFNARAEADGYDWKAIWYLPLPEGQYKEGNLRYTGNKDLDVLGVKHGRVAKGAHAIPNTLRGSDPSMSPDGQTVAFFEYTDGTTNLVTIKLDGSEKKYLTKFEDGTWMQRVDWSPDGKTLVLALHRQFQQDLYLMDADGGNLRAITFDRWEDMDPEFTKNGDILFCSDPTGIMQIYRWDHASGKIFQESSVIASAEAPAETPDGNIVYVGYTGNGLKIEGIQRADFLERDVTATFGTNPDPAAVKATWEFREDLSTYVPEKYKFPLMAPSGVPIFRFTNDSRDDFTMQAGAQIFIQDYVEDHFFYTEAMVGEDWGVRGFYIYQGWYPNFQFGAIYGEAKFPYGFLLDEDQHTETTADQGIYEGKQQQNYGYLIASVDYPWNAFWRTGIFSLARTFGFRQTGDVAFDPYMVADEVDLTQSYSSLGSFSRSANPRGGRYVELTLGHGYTDIVYKPYGGVTVDDGELLDAYDYNKAELRWVEQIPVPDWGGIFTEANRNRHTIQVDVDLGIMDRNVDRNDEFLAGGQHPFYWGSNSLRPNTLFAGYPAYSLSGETMAMINLAYRFPLRRELNKHIGPLYVYDLTAQIMGTAGNLWSFASPEDPSLYYRNEFDERVAYNTADLHREIPFVDEAHKNGNYMLYDAGAEIRVSSTLFDSFGWNSFFRVTYGFNEIRGYGDVNGDDIQDTTDNAVGDELSNETEAPGFRFYLGLGTGW